MRNGFVIGLLVLLAGCSWGEYQIPKQDYRTHVQVLGVMPVLVDAGALSTYPEPEQLLALLKRTAAGKHKVLVERLRKQRAYFDVRTLTVERGGAGAKLLEAPLPADEAGRPLGYRVNPQAVAELARHNALDALLVVVLSVEQIEEKRLSRNLLESLRTRYEDVMATAMVVDRKGQMLWQMAGEDAVRMAFLQYADFDEAHFNRTDKVRVKNIALSGVDKALAEPGAGDLPKVYHELFARIVSGVSPGMFE